MFLELSPKCRISNMRGYSTYWNDFSLHANLHLHERNIDASIFISAALISNKAKSVVVFSVPL